MPVSDVRPTVVVSRCLGFDCCRYDGAIIESEFVRRLGAHVTFQPVCPEVAIGLGVPRPPIQVVRAPPGLRLVQPATGQDLTAAMQAFIADFLEQLGPVDGFILKSRSPSCGMRAVPIHAPAPDYPVRGRGRGFFGAAVAARFPRLPAEDERRLANRRRREHFLTRLFAQARRRIGVRTIKEPPYPGELQGGAADRGD